MPGDRSDLYAVLGLSSRATQEQIRRAYRTVMRQNHPDTRPLGDPHDNAAANLALQQAIAAYTVLADPASRARYDLHTSAQRTSTPIRIRTAPPRPPGWTDQPPILAGPVRWHRSR